MSEVADALTHVGSFGRAYSCAQAKQDLEAAGQERDSHAKAVQEASELVSKADHRPKEETESLSRNSHPKAFSKDDIGDSEGKRSLD